jgi:single-strand DNA-binding protein
LTKGKQVAIEGRLNQERWEKDGQKHSRVKIIATSIQLLGGGKKEEQREPGMDNEPAPMGEPGSDSIPF